MERAQAGGQKRRRKSQGAENPHLGFWRLGSYALASAGLSPFTRKNCLVSCTAMLTLRKLRH